MEMWQLWAFRSCGWPRLTDPMASLNLPGSPIGWRHLRHSPWFLVVLDDGFGVDNVRSLVLSPSGTLLGMPSDFDSFRIAILDLIALRREWLDALALRDTDLQAALDDLEGQYEALVRTTTAADKQEIGEVYREVLKVFGANEEFFAQYPDAAALMLVLRIEGRGEGPLRCCGWRQRGRSNLRSQCATSITRPR